MAIFKFVQSPIVSQHRSFFLKGGAAGVRRETLLRTARSQVGFQLSQRLA
ncbi:hypothetical protein [Mastigocladopsis repens]|nr:hypothetical protein [Mastigocladopsis repens]